MSADRRIRDTFFEVERLMRCVEDLHEAVVTGLAITPSMTHALVQRARIAHYHADRAQIAAAMFPERRDLPCGDTLTLPGRPDRTPPAVREFLQEHAQAIAQEATK